jgi:hypothetical protein
MQCAAVMKTVEILRPAVPHADNATYKFRTFHELKMLLEKVNR